LIRRILCLLVHYMCLMLEQGTIGTAQTVNAR
jgi:hypothetical protein